MSKFSGLGKFYHITLTDSGFACLLQRFDMIFDDLLLISTDTSSFGKVLFTVLFYHITLTDSGFACLLQRFDMIFDDLLLISTDISSFGKVLFTVS